LEVKVNYTVVGLTVLLLGAALIATTLWLSVGFHQKAYKIYAIFMSEPASGLSDDAPVRYNGVKVGNVRQISLNHNNPHQVIILLNIEEGTPITVSTTATLTSQGITGVSYISLTAEGSNLTPLRTPEDYPYPIIPARPSLFNQLDKAIREVSENVGSVSDEIKRVFDQKNAENIKSTLNNLNSFSENLAKNNAHIQKSLINADAFSQNLAQVSKDFPRLVADLRRTVNHFNAMSLSIKKAGNQVSETMETGTSALNKLSQQTLPAATELIHKLDTVADNVESITRLMKQNPSVVIRGTKPTKPGPGEH
jgi:phospholipid/cholesterol/gamma-HCH transport system substrate-binding protein